MKLRLTITANGTSIMELAMAAHKALFEIWMHACTPPTAPPKGFEYGSDTAEEERTGASWRIAHTEEGR